MLMGQSMDWYPLWLNRGGLLVRNTESSSVSSVYLLNYEVCLSYPSKFIPGHIERGRGRGGATLLYYRGSMSSMCHF